MWNLVCNSSQQVFGKILVYCWFNPWYESLQIFLGDSSSNLHYCCSISVQLACRICCLVAILCKVPHLSKILAACLRWDRPCCWDWWCWHYITLAFVRNLCGPWYAILANKCLEKSWYIVGLIHGMNLSRYSLVRALQIYTTVVVYLCNWLVESAVIEVMRKVSGLCPKWKNDKKIDEELEQ